MKERPILFSAPMVRAILEGRKTQTRRVIKYPAKIGESGWHPIPTGWQYLPGGSERPVCPYGVRGDRLWLRETWRPMCEQGTGCCYVLYQSGGVEEFTQEQMSNALAGNLTHGDNWRPSIFMPRWASRITLEITEVRVQRLQDISDEDARAEGVDLSFADQGMYWQGCNAWTDERNPAFDAKRAVTGPRAAFGMLWDSINAKREGGRKTHDKAHAEARKPYSWSSNPWVWAITFRKI